MGRSRAAAAALAGLLALPLAAQDGVRPKLGGLPFDSGVALGAEYRKTRLANGPVDFRALTIVSFKKYLHGEAWFGMPRLWDRRLFVEAGVRYRNYPQDNFWGLGPDSRRGMRTSFRLEDVEPSGEFGVRPARWLRVGTTAGWLKVNTGPGQDKDRPSIEELFTAAEVPALEAQPVFVRVGGFVEVDYRDQPANPRSGGYYVARWNYYDDRDFGLYTFRRYEVDARQFFAVTDRGTVALRGRTSLSDTSRGQDVPFFLMPTAGGGNDLRGFHQYRFRDRNALVMNLEYRWSMNAFVELLGFGDAGRVFHRPGEIGLGGLEGAGGLGARVKFQERIFAGLDLGGSREGVRLWFRGSVTF
jgi:hypothetical protein